MKASDIRPESTVETVVATLVLALVAAFVCYTLFSAPQHASASEILQFIGGQRTGASQGSQDGGSRADDATALVDDGTALAGEEWDGDGPAYGTDYGTDTSVGVYTMVREVAYASDGSELLVWSADLDEHGNAARTFLGQSFADDSSSVRSDVSFDGLGGMVSSRTERSYTSDGETAEGTVDELIIVDERSGRVESYVREDTVALLGYGASGKVNRVMYLYSLNELGGNVTDYDDRGLPVAVGNVDGRDETGQIEVVPWAAMEWAFDDAGRPVEVRVINVDTGGEWRFSVETDEHGNVVAIYGPDGSPGFEFAYEYVENPSALVAAMPPEFLADIALIGGVPD